MSKKVIDAFLDRQNLYNVNSNFDELFRIVETVRDVSLDLVNDGKLTEEQFQQLQVELNGLIKKGDVSIYDINKNLGKIDQTYLTEDLLRQIAGDANVNAVPADNSLTTSKYIDKSVTPEKTTFFDIQKTNNLFDIQKYEDKKTIEADGSIVTDENRWVTGFIPLNSLNNEKINITDGSYRIGLYRDDKSFISRTGLNGTQYQPVSSSFTQYIRISGTIDINEVMINKGNELLPYEKPTDLSNIKLKPEHFDIPPIDINNIKDNSIEPSKLIDKSITPEKTTFFDVQKSNNLLNIEKVQINTTVDTDGSIINDSLRWLTDYIDVDSTLGESINITEGTYRIALYRDDKSFISRGGITSDNKYTPSSSTFAKYVRISGIKDINTIMINKGDSLLPYEEPIEKNKVKLKSEFIDLPDLGDVSFDNIEEHQLSDKLKSKIEQQTQVYTPSIPKLKFDEVSVGYDEALWLSQDGKRIYGKTGSKLWVSFDECTTLTTVIPDTFKSVQAVRELDDGELLFSTERDASGGTQNGRVYKTRGFNKETGTVESYDLKIETPSTEAKVNNSWGMSVYDNFITLSEYGLKTEEGARRVWFSQDFGETFEVVFDQMTDVENIKDAPSWAGDTAHMHTAAFDPYWNRLWVVTGDHPNSAMYYSDDFGETWIWVDVGNEPIVQYTGIIALPNCVLFGSDRAPNGVYVYYRGQKSDMPKVEPLLLINDRDKISHIFQLPFKRDWQSETPVYFGATNAGDIPAKSTCIATVDGKKAFIVHENEQNEMFGGKCGVFLGPTEQGNIIGTFQDDGISGFRIGKAKTLDWIKM